MCGGLWGGLEDWRERRRGRRRPVAHELLCVLHCVVIVLQGVVAECCGVLQGVAGGGARWPTNCCVCCSMLSLSCRVLQGVAECNDVEQCVAMCCRWRRSVAHELMDIYIDSSWATRRLCPLLLSRQSSQPPHKPHELPIHIYIFNILSYV